MRRVFFDWARPLLPDAAAWLLDQQHGQSTGTIIDLTGITVVTPGRRAGRLLLGQLLAAATDRDAHILPPTMITPEVLFSHLHAVGNNDSARPAATGQETIEAWRVALQGMNRETLAPLVREPPPRDDPIRWRALARTFIQVERHVAAGGLSIEQAVQRIGVSGRFHDDSARWAVLARIAAQATDHLHQADLASERDIRQAVLANVSRQDTPTGPIFLVGVAQLPSDQQRLLRIHGDVTALVHAPSEENNGFDDLGCVRTSTWLERTIDVPDSALCVVPRAPDQAEAVINELAALDGQYGTTEITIGLGDESLAPLIEQRCHWAGVSTHSAIAPPLSRTPPAMLLRAAATYLDDARFATFAALLRHPDLERFIRPKFTIMRRRREAERDMLRDDETLFDAHERDHRHAIWNWQALLDRYFSEYLQEHVGGTWLGSIEQQHAMRDISTIVDEWLADMTPAPEPLSAWTQPVFGLLRRVYADRDAHPHDRAACERIVDNLAAWPDIPAALQPRVGAAEALRMAVEDTASDVSAPDDAAALEMVGWLEVGLDPSPVLILTSVNDGHIPGAVVGDAFLSDAVRRELGLPDNDDRYARDAYLLTTLLHSKAVLRIIAGRENNLGDALPPSRLLLAGDPDDLTQRVRALTESVDAMVPAADEDARVVSLFGLIAPPEDLPNLESMSVTAFGAYLECSYRFMLGRMLGLKEVETDAMELDARQFGQLAHDVLECFGREAGVRDSTDEQEIESFLIAALDQQISARFGPEPRSALLVQRARLLERLASFASWQAAHRRGGWRIAEVELKIDRDSLIELDIPGQTPVRLTGRIDRIDQHDHAPDEWLIIDYKTGDRAKSPERVHHHSQSVTDRWYNLQLPLYDYLARALGYSGTIRTGYVVLPREPHKVGLLSAPWSAEDIAAAVDLARQIVRDIRGGRFTHNNDYPYDNYSRLCRQGVLQ